MIYYFINFIFLSMYLAVFYCVLTYTMAFQYVIYKWCCYKYFCVLRSPGEIRSQSQSDFWWKSNPVKPILILNWRKYLAYLNIKKITMSLKYLIHFTFGFDLCTKSQLSLNQIMRTVSQLDNFMIFCWCSLLHWHWYNRPCKQINQTAGQRLVFFCTCKYSRWEQEFFLSVYLRSSQWGYLRSLSFLSLARMAPPSLCRLTNLLSSSTSLIRVLRSIMHCCTVCWTKKQVIQWLLHIKNFGELPVLLFSEDYLDSFSMCHHYSPIFFNSYRSYYPRNNILHILYY